MRREAEAGTDFPRQNRSLLLQPGRCFHDVVDDLKQLLNSRSQTSVHLGQLASGRFAPIGDVASGVDDRSVPTPSRFGFSR